MSLKHRLLANEDALNRMAGVTGFGWTASLLGYLGSLVGYSNTLVTNPQSFLYLGGVLFLTTLGLDRLKDTFRNRET